jgi:dienelactone hydrolase
MERIIKINKYYGSLSGMLKKYETAACKDSFCGTTIDEYEGWRTKTRKLLINLIGLDHMESCLLNPFLEERITLDNGILREKVIIQVEPDVYMPLYILIPPKTSEEKQSCFIAPPGHQGAGKFSVAGCYDIPAVNDMIRFYHYDYGMQLAKLGYVALCPDCRGFGERRDEALQIDNDEQAFLNSTCRQLAHMAEPLGETVIGMCTWDLMRLVDYIYERNEWRLDTLGCLGFSGGGMQTLWLTALDDRIRQAVISGYMYGYHDSLLILNDNCSCNYVPHLWEHLDMGDIGALIAPRPLIIQTCSEDHLNGPRGLINAMEQTDMVKKVYEIYGRSDLMIHDIREGGHCWHEEVLEEVLTFFP